MVSTVSWTMYGMPVPVPQGMPEGYCQCQCGSKTNVARSSSAKQGQVKGKPYRFARNHHKSKPFWSLFEGDDPDECWEWQGARSHFGHGIVRVDGVQQGTHRVAWEKTYGPVSEGMWVLHRCDNPPCGNPQHLFLGTHQDNMADMVSKGRGGPPKENQVRGIKVGGAKLTDDDVWAIRYMRDLFSHAELAAMYRVDPSTVSKTLSGERRAG